MPRRQPPEPARKAVVVVVRLFVRPGRETDFRRFETEAARIMARHGGRLERAIRPTATAPADAPLPDEIHVVSFPSAEALAAYRADAELAGLAALRESAIARTELVVGDEIPRYW